MAEVIRLSDVRASGGLQNYLDERERNDSGWRNIIEEAGRKVQRIEDRQSANLIEFLRENKFLALIS